MSDDRTAWMIERQGPQGAEWWTGKSMDDPNFTNDPNAAIKFATFGDGEVVRCHFKQPLMDFCRVTEHKWVGR